ncbi:MAG: endonuclease/exonuclease/phosphatase family protein [Rubrobacter sp.]|nr:endonuclease/exonuclease/phosphatase family protein [Rubrobacter sp.]
MAPSNTGISSGYDLNNDGRTVTEYPPPPPTRPDGSPGEQTAEGRAYGDDSFGFGTFPGQCAMGLLVRPGIKIERGEIRTFQEFLWKDMPGAALPENPETGEGWYTEEELEVFRLSSKSHWDVPVRVPGRGTVHLLASHPTPPTFDGEEDRNGRRNHDEIRFWGDYINGEPYIYDDGGGRGGLEDGESFVILGDLNADPDEGDSFGNPIEIFLFANERVNGDFVPTARKPDPNLDPDDTATFELRVDYVLPSTDLALNGGEVFGHTALFGGESPGDHFPVYTDLEVPKENPGKGPHEPRSRP